MSEGLEAGKESKEEAGCWGHKVWEWEQEVERGDRDTRGWGLWVLNKYV